MAIEKEITFNFTVFIFVLLNLRNDFATSILPVRYK